MSESTRLDPDLDLPPERAASVPSGSAYQCPTCHGIAYNPVCPYCEDDDTEGEDA